MPPPTVPNRFAALPGPPLIERLVLDQQGSMALYHALASHHYRAGPPATATRVLALRDPQAGLAPRARALGMEKDAGRPPVDPGDFPPVAVLVESLPSLSCRMRDVALGGRYGGHLGAGSRAVALNAEVRCISRVVVDPRWRGLGLAVGLVGHALATATTAVTEALAAMGRVSPFFERAGMTAYPRPAHGFDDRLKAALARAGLDPTLAEVDQALARIEALAPGPRAWLERELRRWAGHRRRRGRRSHPVRQTLMDAQRQLHSQPVYYVHLTPTSPPP